MMAAGPMYALAPNCAFYLATDLQTKEVIAVVEAVSEAEAREFFAALRHMLQAAPQVEMRVLESTTLPNGVPVFRMQYLVAMRVMAEEDGRMSGTTRH